MPELLRSWITAVIIVLSAPAVLIAAAYDENVWMTDFDEAATLAKEKNKTLLLNFTGSDWCPPCIMLKDNVFSKEDFVSYAEDNLVLVLLDFPRRLEQPDEVKKQNQHLLHQFGVQSFPTVVILTPNLSEKGRLSGYRRGTTISDYIAQIEDL